MDHVDSGLPPIPAKRYFTIGEVSELCLVKPYVLRYWEQEFVQLKPMKRRGNRRYYQHHEVLLIRRIRELLYDQGFTISGARNQLAERGEQGARHGLPAGLDVPHDDDLPELDEGEGPDTASHQNFDKAPPAHVSAAFSASETRVSARPLQAGAQSTSSTEANWGNLQLDLKQFKPETLTSLREALLEIRDLLS